MNGLDFLEKIMTLRPTPVVMISTLTQRGAESTLRALELGAVDFVGKPTEGLSDRLPEYRKEILSKVHTAARSNVKALTRRRPPKRVEGASLARQDARLSATSKIIAIGSSTGGTEALAQLFSELPPNTPPIVVSQHIPPGFSRTFAERLNRLSAMTVCEASDGDRVLMGHGYIAPGDHHLEVHRDGASYVIRVHQGEKVNRHRPSADVMFRSVVRACGRKAVGVLLTGMGNDGAQGMLEMSQADIPTVAQNEESCVVFGMPHAAIELGGAKEVLHLDDIGSALVRLGKG